MSKATFAGNESYRIGLKLLAIDAVTRSIQLASNVMNDVGTDEPKYVALADQMTAEHREALKMVEDALDGIGEGFIAPIAGLLPDEIQRIVDVAFDLTTTDESD